MTVILATRDRHDAFVMADRIAVVRDGAIEQSADPRTIYGAPRSRFVATLTGDANLLPARISEVAPDGATGRASCFLGPVRCRGEALRQGQEVTLLIRPEQLRIVPEESGLAVGDVEYERYLGSQTMSSVRVGDELVKVLSCEPLVPGHGRRVGLALRQPATDVAVLPD